MQRKSGELIAARSTLQSCARDECPEFIRTDCTAWFAEVQEEVPTLVFAARSQGRDVSDVQVALGERVLAARLDGQVVELDPGEYDFVFRATSQRSLTQHFVIARGERNRLIQVELQPVAAAVAEEPAERAMARPRSLLVPGIFAGVSVLGVAGFAGLGAWGHSNENRLQASCAPGCSDSRVSEVRTKYLLADVSLGVGVASLAVGAYLFFSGGTSQAQGAVSPPRLMVLASPGSGGLAYGSNF
ncbi:MAG: hypothetical protein ABUL60_01540 [Myxococcales bacterium]